MILEKYLIKAKYLALLIFSPRLWFYIFREKFSKKNSLGINESCGELAHWLLETQSTRNMGGYPISYIPKLGKKLSFPFCETTGYIIETLINLGGDQNIKSALQAGDWLLSMQHADGSFKTNLGHYNFNDKPLTFDTGMCLYGMISLYQNTGNEKYLNAAIKASNWLIGNLDEAGTQFINGLFNDGPRLYYVKVAYAIYKLSIITNDSVSQNQSLSVYRYVLSALNSPGYSKFGFESEFFHLHTLGYILEALLKFAIDLGDDHGVYAVESYLKKEFCVHQGVKFYGRKYVKSSRPDYSYRCLVGESQIAEIYAILGHHLGSEAYLNQAKLMLLSVSGEIRPMLSGAQTFFASKPLYGAYKPFECTNWGPKFYIDAGLALRLEGI